MGSEHSAHLKQATMGHQSEKQGNLYRQHTIANPGGDLEERPGSTSPGPSICSDSDLPYISYTVNRPIGDSPKLSNKQLVKSKGTHRKTVQKYIKKSVHNIVVVKPAISGPNVEKDPDILHLASIPMFLPIMRATLNLPAARDPEVLERLDPAPLTKLCLRYQTHLHTCSNLVATEQNLLIQKVREVNRFINILLDLRNKLLIIKG
ncbi:bloc-1-related complex subunit 5 [Holotrichia oblita]|uniref:Bloc-1-related complex subunit 5 n=2 Tax=Holotrichia oblita TaxID=644536 RepID=A0ACB9TN56_HOLOL|nr:bloc-1-related complex subunit 5 [Holotrichia oblita]KAI4468241.1 bloc-1-related complex subunit 5 [Holotrichia oblita]